MGHNWTNPTSHPRKKTKMDCIFAFQRLKSEKSLGLPHSSRNTDVLHPTDPFDHTLPYGSRQSDAFCNTELAQNGLESQNNCNFHAVWHLLASFCYVIGILPKNNMINHDYNTLMFKFHEFVTQVSHGVPYYDPCVLGLQRNRDGIGVWLQDWTFLKGRPS